MFGQFQYKTQGYSIHTEQHSTQNISHTTYWKVIDSIAKKLAQTKDSDVHSNNDKQSM